MLSAGRWCKLDYNQVPADNGTKSHSDNAFKKGFGGFNLILYD